jgi:hypothetical protein
MKLDVQWNHPGFTVSCEAPLDEIDVLATKAVAVTTLLISRERAYSKDQREKRALEDRKFRRKAWARGR